MNSSRVDPPRPTKASGYHVPRWHVMAAGIEDGRVHHGTVMVILDEMLDRIVAIQMRTRLHFHATW